MSLPQFLVPPGTKPGKTIVLSGRELKHLLVRRIRLGDALLLTDGLGLQLQGILTELSPFAATVTLLTTRNESDEYGVTLAVACLKGNRLETVIEKATEIGVDRVHLFNCERSIASPSDHRVQRLQRIADAATKQSNRSVTPRILGLVAFSAILQLEGYSRRVLFHEACKSTFRAANGPQGASLLMIGPEGGFADGEIIQAMESRAEIVGLGDKPLRSDTAAIVALTLARYIPSSLM